MKRGILITSPRHDLATSYLNHFSSEIVSFCKSKNINLKIIHDSKVTRENFEKSVKKLNYNFLFLNGHGGPDIITGHNNEFLIKLGENENLLKDKFTYARSCWAAAGLGTSLGDNSKGCFIGYNIPFMFLHDKNRSATPNKDSITKPFFKTTNLIPVGILKGRSAKEVDDSSKRAMLKEMKKALMQKEEALLETLWNNYVGQVVCGNKELTFND
jgi:hypothetical protein